MTLTEFLLARIAEDEEDARSAMASMEGRGEQWECRSGTYADHVQRVGPHLRDRQIAEAVFGARHIARHDPARVLAECEAKRAIAELHEDLLDEDQGGNLRSDGCYSCDAPWPCSTLRALALPYADHPDYDEDWRP